MNDRNYRLKLQIFDALPKNIKVFRYLISFYKYSDEELEKVLKAVKDKYTSTKKEVKDTPKEEQDLFKFLK